MTTTKRCAAVFLAACAFVLLGPAPRSATAADKPSDTDTDAERFVGEWLVDELLISGVHTEKDESPGQRMTITDKQITLTYADGTTREMHYTLDPTTKLKSIDITHPARKGQPKEHTWPGIYKFGPGTLTIAVENGGQVRPQDYQTSGDSGIVYKLKRAKAAK